LQGSCAVFDAHTVVNFWVQYNELGGIQDSEVPGGSGSAAYTTALQNLDMDMPQYIHDNTDDEFTHQNFLNAYLISKTANVIVALADSVRKLLTLRILGSRTAFSSGCPLKRLNRAAARNSGAPGCCSRLQEGPTSRRSSWLELLPVTQEVASSSPVAPAIFIGKIQHLQHGSSCPPANKLLRLL
jgi:hypothetical protein